MRSKSIEPSPLVEQPTFADTAADLTSSTTWHRAVADSSILKPPIRQVPGITAANFTPLKHHRGLQGWWYRPQPCPEGAAYRGG
jgi:hypothetical protein